MRETIPPIQKTQISKSEESERQEAFIRYVESVISRGTKIRSDSKKEIREWLKETQLLSLSILEGIPSGTKVRARLDLCQRILQKKLDHI